MRRCVAYIHYADTTSKFNLNVKFIEFLTCFRFRPITSFWFDLGLPYFAHRCKTIIRCVAYIHDPVTTLNFNLKVKLLVFDIFLCPAHYLFLFDIGLPYLAQCSITMRRCDTYIHVPDSMLTLWPQGQIYRVFVMFSCPAHNFFLNWYWLTIFGTRVYHHETVCRVHSWPRYDLEIWPQDQIYRVLTCFCVRPIPIFWFDIGLPYLSHGSITIRGCDRYIHVPDSMLTFDLKVKFIGFCHVFMSDL